MNNKIAICPNCHTKIECDSKSGEKEKIKCPKCGKEGFVTFNSDYRQLDFYPLAEPYAYAKILKNVDSLDKYYKVIEPYLSLDEQKTLNFIWDKLIKSLNIRLDELGDSDLDSFLYEKVKDILDDNEIHLDELTLNKVIYYIKRESIGYGKIDPLMHDPNIEDISCDGNGVPIFLYHRKYGSVRSNIVFPDEEELSSFVVNLAQKCGKHISIAEPMLDATMPDGSRIQMTLSDEITTKGSTFTIRRFRTDPFTPPDLIELNTVSVEMMAYFWLAIENHINALIAGGTASGKTTILNALSLFIPRDAKIVSIEETREINLPHPNWIPGVARTGFGEVISDKLVGEIDMYELMKAALRQRPEYLLVGEIRGKEAYVLFQAMATGHATYSTVHADSAKSLIHRLEGKPIEIPRIMLQALNIISIHFSTSINGKNVRRCKKIIEIIDVDPLTKEILTNEVFNWNYTDDKFVFTGKSYVLEEIRNRWELTKEEMTDEIQRRAEVLEWMRKNNIRIFTEVAKAIALYKENSDEFIKKIRHSSKVPDRVFNSKSEKNIDSEKSTKKENEVIGIEAVSVKNKKVKSIISKNEKVEKDILQGIETMNSQITKILIQNGYNSFSDLKDVSVDTLSRIKGIDKKSAELIISEVNKRIK
jgi:flagellar protein FlaI